MGATVSPPYRGMPVTRNAPQAGRVLRDGGSSLPCSPAFAGAVRFQRRSPRLRGGFGRPHTAGALRQSMVLVARLLFRPVLASRVASRSKCPEIRELCAALGGDSRSHGSGAEDAVAAAGAVALLAVGGLPGTQ